MRGLPVDPADGRSRAAASRSIASRLSGNAAGTGGAAVNNASTGSVTILDGSEVTDNPGLMIPDPSQ